MQCVQESMFVCATLAHTTELRQDRAHVAYLSSESAPTTYTSGLLIGSTVVSPSAIVRDQGVFTDQDLTMKTHVQRTASRCFTTLRQLRSIRRYIPTSVFHSLVSALLSSAGWITATVSWLTCLSLTSSVSSRSKMPQEGTF